MAILLRSYRYVLKFQQHHRRDEQVIVFDLPLRFSRNPLYQSGMQPDRYVRVQVSNHNFFQSFVHSDSIFFKSVGSLCTMASGSHRSVFRRFARDNLVDDPAADTLTATPL
jgi:hypothetical protein